METPKIYGWYSQKYVNKNRCHCDYLHYYENINGKIVAVTNISTDPTDSNTVWDDILFVGELGKFHHNVKIY